MNQLCLGILVLLMVGQTSLAFADHLGKIAVLTSVSGLPTNDVEIQQKWYEIVRSRFSDLPLEVVHYQHASQYDLFSLLHSEQIVALFWMSHGSKGMDREPLSETGGLTIGEGILDYWGADVAPLLDGIPEHLKYLGLIACNASLIIKDLKIDMWSHHRNTKDLVVDAPDHTIEATEGLTQSVEKAHEHLVRVLPLLEKAAHQTVSELSPSKTTVKLQIKRRIPAECDPNQLHEVRVENHGAVLTVFPKGIPGEVQRQDIFWNIDLEEIALNFGKDGKNKIRLTVNSGLDHLSSSQDEVVLGEFQFEIESAPWSWNLTLKPNGKPLGVLRHIYEPKLRD